MADSVKLTFNDTAAISEYAVDPMKWISSEGLMIGMGNNKLMPQGTATRAQAAQLLMRYLEK